MARELSLGHDSAPPGSPVANAYFRTVDKPQVEEPAEESSAAAAATADVLDMLFGAGVLPKPPRALLGGPAERGPRLAHLQAYMQSILERDDEAFSMRNEEVAYLAHSILAGCSIQERPFTAQEASDAAVGP